MNKEDIIKLARECDLQPYYDSQAIAIERFAALVAAAEREACATALDSIAAESKEIHPEGFVYKAIQLCADFIRARGNT
jgi:hypothetical protein